MKHLIISTVVFALFQSTVGLSQSPHVALEQPEANILYRGYNNRIIPAVENNDGQTISITGTNCTIVHEAGSKEYFIHPGNGKTAVLSVGIVTENGIVPIKEVEYRVQNLPDPLVFWGGSMSGGKASADAHEIAVSFPPFAALHSSFEVLHWTMTIGEETVSGQGNKLDEAQSMLNSIQQATPVSLDVVVQGSDGIQRKLQGNWQLVPQG